MGGDGNGVSRCFSPLSSLFFSSTPNREHDVARTRCKDKKRNEGREEEQSTSLWTRSLFLSLSLSFSRQITSQCFCASPVTSVLFLRVPSPLRNTFPSLPPPTDFPPRNRASALMLHVFSLVRAAFPHPSLDHPRPPRRRMLLEGIRRGAHGSSPVVAPH